MMNYDQDFIGDHMDATGESGAGITVFAEGDGSWMCWDEVLEFHEWLTALIKAAE